MENSVEKKRLSDFVDRFGHVGIKSTGATLINYSGVLYNVDGSSPDPTIDGNNWKQLLKSHGVDEPCYVTNPTPSGNSHPEFSVGGHMTPNISGHVASGADTYLMPLCSWHNHKSRDGVAFQHSNTLMLKLSGFMESELAASFTARLPSKERFAIIYESGKEWKNANLTDDQASAAKSGNLSEDVLFGKPTEFVLLERIERDNESNYVLRESRLSK